MHLLAVGEGDARQRLLRVYRDLRTLEPADLPPPVYAELRSILNEMTRYGPMRDEDDGEPFRPAIQHTMARIRKRTAARLAERIYALHLGLPSVPR